MTIRTSTYRVRLNFKKESRLWSVDSTGVMSPRFPPGSINEREIQDALALINRLSIPKINVPRVGSESLRHKLQLLLGGHIGVSSLATWPTSNSGIQMRI